MSQFDFNPYLEELKYRFDPLKNTIRLVNESQQRCESIDRSIEILENEFYSLVDTFNQISETKWGFDRWWNLFKITRKINKNRKMRNKLYLYRCANT